jgi:glycosyltransferase involved in cell wall biosynthesis
MKTLVVAHDSSMYGASQSLLTALAGIKHIKNRNVLVLLPYPGKIEDELSSLGIAYKILPIPKCTDYKRRVRTLMSRLKKTYHYYRKVRKVLPEFKKIVEEFKPDVIYSNTSVVSIGYMIAKKLKIPHVWHVREFGDVDYVYFPAKSYINKCVARSEKSIFGSEALRNAWLGRKAPNSHVVYNGIFQTELKYSPRKLPNDLIRIGIVGGFIFGKGQDIGIKAFASIAGRVPNCSLTLYGDVMDKAFYQNLLLLTRELRIEDKVFIKGFVTDKDNIFGNLDVLLNCSRTEGFGRTIVEAMSYGVPVIGNYSGGIPEIIDNKINGLLYRDTPESLAQAIVMLISSNELYHSLSVNGIEKAKQFSIPQYVESIDKILAKAAGID